MTKKNEDGGPALPRPAMIVEGLLEHGPQEGMSLRDYFAAAALTGLLACPKNYRGADTMSTRAERAFEYADAMLAARAAVRKAAEAAT